jgi:glycosyltransferase involved in cell wall biosynthesis
MSESESFGVSVLEASACEKPVIVSDVGGLPEVVEKNVTGFIVNDKDYMQLSVYLQKLINDRESIKQMGINGRKMVEKKYNWKDNVLEMSNIYENWNI